MQWWKKRGDFVNKIKHNRIFVWKKRLFCLVWCLCWPSVPLVKLLPSVRNLRTHTHTVWRLRKTLIFCMSGDGYATVSSQQVRHTDSGVLWEVRRERRTARAIFKVTIRAISKVGSDAALFCKPDDFCKGSLLFIGTAVFSVVCSNDYRNKYIYKVEYLKSKWPKMRGDVQHESRIFKWATKARIRYRMQNCLP